MKQPKICFLLTRPEPHRIPMLSRIAETVNAEFEILYCARSMYQPHDLDEAKECKMPYRYLPGAEWKTDSKNQASVLLNVSVIAELRRMHPDLILLAGYSNATMLFAWSYAILRQIPYGIFNESHLLKKRAKWKLFLKKCLLPLIVRRAAVCLASGSKAKEYLEYYGAKPAQILIFPNTCNVDFFLEESVKKKALAKQSRSAFGLKEDGILFIYVGRLIAYKGLSTLLQAAKRAKDSGAKFQMLIIGDGPLRESLESSIKEQGLSEIVVIKGFIQNRELAAVYAMADVLVLPSIEETWGVVVNEAMACGLALLLSDQVGAGYDLLKESENGYWFKSGDERELSEKIRLFCSQPHIKESFGVTSRNIIRNFTYQLGVESFRTIAGKFNAGN